MKEKEIRVTDILLDTGNYRTGKQDDQREAIKALIEEQKNKLVNLAKDIIENGLSPLETVMVHAVPDEKNRYIVVEGNRRVAAIKLATQPDLAADTTWHNAFKRLHKLLPGQVPKKITCKIAGSKEEAFPWIQRRHDTGLKGAGLESWSTIATYRAHAAQGKSAPEYDALEFVLTHGQLDADVQDRVMGQDFPITNLKRLMDSAYVSEQLELDKGDPALTTTASKKWVLSMLRDFVTIISREEYEDHKPFAVKDIYDANDQKRFFNKLVGKHPKPARRTKRWTINANTNLSDTERGKQKKKKPKRPTSERKKLIPKNTDVLPPMGRANDILHELRKLEVFSMFFLNRTNRSGIIHSGGMIGGNDQTGEWKIDARYNKPELIGRIEAIAAYSNRIRVSNQDAETFLRNAAPTLPAKTLIFLDPPYFQQGQSLYENHYQPEDHIRLAGVFRKKLRRNWIISYDNHPQIQKAYRGCKKLVYSLPYSANRRYEGSEVMFFSEGLCIPPVESPLSALWGLT